MEVLATKAPGLIHICSNCRALLGFTTGDIYQSRYIYCPLCKSKELTNLDLSYNGVVKNGDKQVAGAST